jgi:hypothetical protein
MIGPAFIERRFATLAAVVAATLLLSACNDGEVPTGPVRNETREVSSFDSIDVEGNTKLDITVGKPESLVIEGRDLFVKRIKTDVRGDTLHIKSSRKDWGWTNGQARVTLRITVPHLESLQLQGGNEVHISGYDGGESKIDIEGAADIEAAGQLDALRVTMSGAGNADLSQLIANEATVRVSGVGSIYVHPRDTLDATMNGVGAIFYSGSPREVNTHMNGLGTISHRDKKVAGDNADTRARKRIDPDVNANPDPNVDPDSLQPEYEKPRTPPDPSKVKSTGVI